MARVSYIKRSGTDVGQGLVINHFSLCSTCCSRDLAVFQVRHGRVTVKAIGEGTVSARVRWVLHLKPVTNVFEKKILS